MGMCAIRGPAVTGGAREEVDAVDAGSPRSTMSATSSSGYVSSASQELEAGSDFDNDSGGALWQRTIPRGRRCRPLCFSGLIVYDASGNQLDHCPRMLRDGHEDRAELDGEELH